jgi:hypothetical protein
MKDLENYNKETLTIDLAKANVYGLFGMIPIILIYTIPFYLIWKEKLTVLNLKNYFKEFNSSGNPLAFSGSIIIVMILGIILHELIHGITWAKYASKGFKSIKFGILWKMLTPYCHCKEPLKVKEYILGAIMPAIVLGLIPALYAILSGNVLLLVFGIFFTTAAIGDFMIINLLRKENMNSLVLDHPSEAGCFIYRELKSVTGN